MGFTRRRIAVVIAAAAGLVAGFPRRAWACSAKRDFGDFTVNVSNGLGLTSPFSWVGHKFQYNNLSIDAQLLKPNGDVTLSILVYGVETRPTGSRFRVLLRFNPGQTYEREGRGLGANPAVEEPTNMVNVETTTSDRLFRDFQAAESFDLAVFDGDERIGAALGISLKGSAKASSFALAQLRKCYGLAAAPPAGSAGSAQGCFLTTACVEMLGLDDDCFELRTLRRFRDVHLVSTPQGRAMSSAYRELAPSILAALPVDDRERILRAVYARYILPSAICVRLGLNGLATKVYVTGMRALMQRYAPDLLASRRAEMADLFGPETVRASR